MGVCTEMLSSLEELIDSEASLKQRKTVELLMQSCYLARLMKGCRTTSCKVYVSIVFVAFSVTSH